MLHSNGDGIDIAVRDGRIAGVRGRARDRVNRGRLDPKDRYGWQANHAGDRLTRPLVREGGRLVGGGLGHRDGPGGRPLARAAGRAGRRGRIGFYTTGQLFLEEYYTLAVIGKAGIGTPHMDGNTRLCTATAAAALKASFGSDGQPGSYTDVDHCDAIALYGHNVAETQAVLWMRMLDRRRGPDPPRMLCVDPRETAVAREADVHLAPRPGTNLALMNGLQRELLRRGWIDAGWVREHALGLEALEATVDAYPPARVRDVCDVAEADLAAAAELLGTSERLLSTVLQGFYQSNQATAAACAVNNVHLLRGMLGRPGAGVLQMNGQPTAQNTRETGADGDLPGFRNWENAAHVARARGALERRSDDDPALVAAHARDADLALRRAGLDAPAVDLGDEPRGLAARPRAHPPDPRARGAVRRRPGPVHDGDGRAGRRRAAGRDLGREDRRAHERRPHRAPRPSTPSTRRARPAPTSTSSSTTRAGWTSATATAPR